jgi:serine/threonine-protein kinase
VGATDALAQVRAALADRYLIERELGRGGMAVVYLARDLKHDRYVAVKILDRDVAADVKTERFLREIQLAARLTHPNILSIHDSGDAGGVLFYVMPYLEGKSLRDRLEIEQRLSLHDALQIARQVAAALAHAHAQGVVHRDIKPENILFQAGQAVVADFGVARAMWAAQGPNVTQPSIAVGTPSYMSPEQASGSPQVDGRSDLYSLGCVVYEMLAGHAPFVGENPQAILARHLLDPVPRLKAARPGVPEHIEQAVLRALAKTPEDRFPTVADFELALLQPPSGAQAARRWARISAGLAIVVAAAVAARAFLPRGGPTNAATKSVAVLPFVNLSGDTAQEYFSDGVTEELTNALTQIQGLQVPARTSSFAFKGKNTDIREIGRRLQVTTVLEGSVRRSGDRVRVSAQLINVANGYHLWSQTYDRELSDVLAVQEDISRAITSALRMKLAPGESAALVPYHPRSVEAYDLYLRGRYFWGRRNRDELAKAIYYFERAIALDSAYALAYSALSDAYAEAPNRGLLADSEAYPQAEAAAITALSLDDSLAEAHASLGKILARYRGDRRAGEREFQRALALNPEYPFAHAWYGLFVLAPDGRWDEAVHEGTLGAQLEPMVAPLHGMLGQILYRARRYDGSIAAYQKARQLDPELAGARGGLGAAYLAQGLIPDALAELEGSLEAAGARNAGTVARLGMAYLRAGRRDAAERLLAELVRRSRRERVWQGLALLYAAFGDRERSLDALERMPTGPGTAVLTEEVFDPLRSEPRFKELLRRADVPATPPQLKE